MKHSVILPTFNGSAYILEAIGSVLNQIEESDELIIIDDASTDCTREILSDITDSRVVKLFRNANGGISRARNDGLNAAAGDYVSFIDHDDIWPPNRQAYIDDAISKENSPAMITGHIEHFYSPELTMERRSNYKLPPNQSAVMPGTSVISRQLVLDAGSFNPQCKAGEFIDLMSRIKRLAPKTVKIDQVLLLRRIHATNYTLTHAGLGQSYLSVIRDHLRRNRND